MKMVTRLIVIALFLNACARGHSDSGPLPQDQGAPVTTPVSPVGNDPNCLSRSCGELWLHQLVGEKILQIVDAMKDPKLSPMISILGAVRERSLAQSAHLGELLAAQGVQLRDVVKSERGRSAYNWLFTRLVDEGGLVRSPSELQKLPQQISDLTN